MVFLAAGRVGGILANDTYPAEFIQQNLAIEMNVIHEAWRVGVKELLFLGSSCIYPRDCPQPIREDYLLSGPLEPTNRAYAVAKIAGIEMCWSHNRQYGTHYFCVMPTNLYGPDDNYDPESSHVLPALIRRFHEAKTRGDRCVTLWGTGAPRREFLYSDDLAAACVLLMQLGPGKRAAIVNADAPPMVNVGCGEDQTIRELAELVRRVVGTDAADRVGLDQARRHAAQAARYRQTDRAGLEPDGRTRGRYPADLRGLRRRARLTVVLPFRQETYYWGSCVR